MADLHKDSEEYHLKALPQPLVPYSRSWHIVKIVLHSFSLVIVLVLIGLAGSSSVASYRDYYGDAVWIFTLPAALCCGTWDAAEFITLCVRRRKLRGIHPGAHVGVELCLWLLCAIMGGLLVPSAITYTRPYGYSDGDPGLVIAADTFLIILSLTHLVLFGRSCKETHQRNRARAAVKMVYIPGGGAPFIAPEPYRAVAVYVEPPLPVNLDDRHAEDPGQSIGDSEDPPSKEVIPGLVRSGPWSG